MPVDYGQLASLGMGPAELAAAFRREYFADRPETFPVNPFQMLRDEGVRFSFRPFGGYEGVYIPASDEEDGAVVGINLDRQIT